MYKIEVRVTFKSGHRTGGHKKCRNPHGEAYTAIFIFEGNKLDKSDMLIDFGPIKTKIKKWINKNLDHAMLLNKKDVKLIKFFKENNYNVYKMDSNPTAEKIAELLYKKVKKDINPLLKKVGIIESFPKNRAWYFE